MAAPPSISVVIPTRDRPELLRDALRSVAAQQLPPLEVRIADDGERPLSREFTALGPPECTNVRVGAGLLAAARNRGSDGARGDVLAFLDDDDRWLPDHLEGLAESFRDPAVEIAWRDCAVIREELRPDGTRRELERRVIARDWDPALMRTDDYLPPSAWGVRRSFFERLGGFDESFPFSEDWDFLMRAAAVTTPRRVPGVTVEVRMRDRGNMSADFGPARLDCLCKLSERHDLPPIVPKTFWEVAEAVDAASRRATSASCPG
jgi:glycosyltransferase involved in cell wall biosynthesis